MSDSTTMLKKIQQENEFFIGIDSDGCVFDSMELKHMECFCPKFIDYFGLNSISQYAKEAWEFVCLHSKYRGTNRFMALIKVLDLLKDRPEVITRNFIIPELTKLKEWINKEHKLGNPALKKEIERNYHAELKLALDWSIDVNKAVEKMLKNVVLFPKAKECLSIIKQRADSFVISQTPYESIEREWKEHNLERLVKVIVGQETGTKTQQLKIAANGRYKANKSLMIGDAPGDLIAAKENNFLFYPIIPGKEEKLWNLLYEEVLDRFFNLKYEGDYEMKLISEFKEQFPENPSWKEQEI